MCSYMRVKGFLLPYTAGPQGGAVSLTLTRDKHLFLKEICLCGSVFHEFSEEIKKGIIYQN